MGGFRLTKLRGEMDSIYCLPRHSTGLESNVESDCNKALDHDKTCWYSFQIMALEIMGVIDRN